jgi:hypothetical protein
MLTCHRPAHITARETSSQGKRGMANLLLIPAVLQADMPMSCEAFCSVAHQKTTIT